MKPRKTLSIYILLAGVMGLSIVGGVLAFQIFSAATKTQATPEQQAAIKPIDGVINKDVVDNLAKRTVITSADLVQLEIAVPAVTPTPTMAVVVTPSPEATTEATTTGQ